jgi:hypothetical protein
VLDQDAEEAFDRTEQRAMDHDRLMCVAVRAYVFEAEALGQVEVELQGGELPRTTDGVTHIDIDLGPVESAGTFVDRVVQPGAIQRLAQARRRHLPQRVLADELLHRLGRQLRLKFIEPKGPQHRQHEVQQRREFVVDHLERAEDVCVVLREAA